MLKIIQRLPVILHGFEIFNAGAQLRLAGLIHLILGQALGLSHGLRAVTGLLQVEVVAVTVAHGVLVLQDTEIIGDRLYRKSFLVVAVGAHGVDHVALSLREHFRGNLRPGPAHQRLGELECEIRHLRFAVEIQNQIIGQRSGNGGAGLEEFFHREIRVGIAAQIAISAPVEAQLARGLGRLPDEFVARAGEAQCGKVQRLALKLV